MEEADAAPRVRLELLAPVKVINLSAASLGGARSRVSKAPLDLGPMALA
jgi:hypothetical protein